MTLIQRCVFLMRRIRFPPQFAAAARSSHPNYSPCNYLLRPIGLCHHDSNFSARSKYHWDLMLGLVLAGPTAVFIGLSMNTAFAENAAEAELVAADEQGEAYVTGLRKIEDDTLSTTQKCQQSRQDLTRAAESSIVARERGQSLNIGACSQKYYSCIINCTKFLVQALWGKLDEAEKFFRSAIDEAKEGFGPRDPHVASSYNNLAELYRVRKAFEKAEPLYLDAINILEEAFGKDDIRVGAALHNLGQFYLAQRKLEQAQKCYERALKIEGRVLGYGHTDYANTMYHLGTVLHLLGKEKDSEALIQESIRILEEGGLGETTTCIRRMRYLSQMLLSSNRLVEAEKLQRKILHVLELPKGWDSLDTVMAAEGLALTLQSLGSLSEAQDLLERCLAVRKKILPQNHIQLFFCIMDNIRTSSKGCLSS